MIDTTTPQPLLLRIYPVDRRRIDDAPDSPPLWDNMKAMGRDLGAGPYAPYGWRERNNLPPARYDLKIVDRARKAGQKDITLEILAEWRARHDANTRMR